MGKDVLVILMVAFGLFAIVMFVLFFIYLKKYYNSRHINEDYKNEIDEYPEEDDSQEYEEVHENVYEEVHEDKKPISYEREHANIKEVDIQDNNSFDNSELDDFVPIKKK